MSAHWKFGNDFAIRYGGRGNIQWYFGEGIGDAGRTIGNIASLAEPIGLVLQALDTVAAFLQWWELRKMNFLSSAQFEERRIGWLIDLLGQWHTEVTNGEFRLDTVSYLDREVSKLLEKIEQNSLIDVPSSVLLAVERSTLALVDLNRLVNSLVTPDFTIVGQKPAFHYRPYYDINGPDEQALKSYFDDASKVIKGAALAIPFLLPITLPWVVATFISQQKASAREKRLDEFVALRNFAIELRSSYALLGLSGQLPDRVRVIPLLAEDDKGESAPHR